MCWKYSFCKLCMSLYENVRLEFIQILLKVSQFLDHQVSEC